MGSNPQGPVVTAWQAWTILLASVLVVASLAASHAASRAAGIAAGPRATCERAPPHPRSETPVSRYFV